MSSRTVHVRLKDKSLCALIHYLEAEGRSYEGRPLSTIISLVVDGMAANFVHNGVVQDVPSQEATAFLNARYSKDIQVGEMPNLRDAIEGALEEDSGFQRPPDRSIDEAVKAKVMGEVAPDLIEADGLDPGELIPEPQIDLAYPPWANQAQWSWEDIVDSTPKDLAVDTLASIPEGPLQEIYKRAVEVVYTGIDFRDWGSETTMKKVTKLYGSYVPWVSIYEGTEGA
jgi:hypothetical protein